MYFPTWIDLKGQDSVPETVHHCVSSISCVVTSEKMPLNMCKMHTQIILLMPKVSSSPLHSIRTFCSIQ